MSTGKINKTHEVEEVPQGKIVKWYGCFTDSRKYRQRRNIEMVTFQTINNDARNVQRIIKMTRLHQSMIDTLPPFLKYSYVSIQDKQSLR